MRKATQLRNVQQGEKVYYDGWWWTYDLAGVLKREVSVKVPISTSVVVLEDNCALICENCGEILIENDKGGSMSVDTTLCQGECS